MTIVEIERVSAPPKLREDAREERERRAGVLEAAALEIEVRGWEQNCLLNQEGSVCAVGAMLFALSSPPDVGRVTTRSRDYGALDHLWGSHEIESPNDGWIGAMGFNDKARTADEVTFLLRWRAQELRDGWDTTRRVAALNPSPLNLEEAK